MKTHCKEVLQKIKSHRGRLTSSIQKMAQSKEISIETIAQIATLAAKTTIDKILKRKHKDAYTRNRGDITSMK